MAIDLSKGMRPLAELDDPVVVGEALSRYDLPGAPTAKLTTLSENATYQVSAGHKAYFLRLHRTGYHTPSAIASELAWLAALRHESGVSTPVPVPTAAGESVLEVDTPSGPRHLVLFEALCGTEPETDWWGADGFRLLGRIAAQLHRHSMSWQVPDGFERRTWGFDETIGDEAVWGRWEDGIGVGANELRLFGRAVDLIAERLDDYGISPDRFGLAHADLRLANLLVDGEGTHVLDFDDCGLTWFMYDFATALSFVEHDPRVPQWRAAWLEGYRSERELDDEHVEILATLVMLRRLDSVAWLASHSYSREAGELGQRHTADTVPLAERFVASDGHSLEDPPAASY